MKDCLLFPKEFNKLWLQENKCSKRRDAKAQRKKMLYFRITKNKISASQRLSVQSNKYFKRKENKRTRNKKQGTKNKKYETPITDKGMIKKQTYFLLIFADIFSAFICVICGKKITKTQINDFTNRNWICKK